MKYAANIITASRFVAALGMVFAAVGSPVFWALYAWCGISDMVDGTIARCTGSESEAGARLDSLADIAFVCICLFKLLPLIPLPAWLIAWIVVIALCKVAAYASGLVLHGRIVALHTIANKAAGFLIFATVPLVVFASPTLFADSFPFSDPALFAIPVCAVATFAAIQEGHLIRTEK